MRRKSQELFRSLRVRFVRVATGGAPARHPPSDSRTRDIPGHPHPLPNSHPHLPLEGLQHGGLPSTQQCRPPLCRGRSGWCQVRTVKKRPEQTAPFPQKKPPLCVTSLTRYSGRTISTVSIPLVSVGSREGPGRGLPDGEGRTAGSVVPQQRQLPPQRQPLDPRAPRAVPWGACDVAGVGERSSVGMTAGLSWPPCSSVEGDGAAIIFCWWRIMTVTPNATWMSISSYNQPPNHRHTTHRILRTKPTHIHMSMDGGEKNTPAFPRGGGPTGRI